METLGPETLVTSFPVVPRQVWDRERCRVVSNPRSLSEAQVILQGWRMVVTARHIMRSSRTFELRHLRIGDSMDPILAVAKGRS